MTRVTPVNPEEQNLVVALLHDANAVLGSDGPDSPTREAELDKVKGLVRLAERIAGGNSDEGDLESVPDRLHPQTASLFGVR